MYVECCGAAGLSCVSVLVVCVLVFESEREKRDTERQKDRERRGHTVFKAAVQYTLSSPKKRPSLAVSSKVLASPEQNKLHGGSSE